MSFKSKVVLFGYSDFSENNTTLKNCDIFLNGMPCMFTYQDNPENPDEQHALIEDLYYVADFDAQTKEASHGHVTIAFSMEEGKDFMMALDQAGMNQKIDYDFSPAILDQVADAKKKHQKGIEMMKDATVGQTPSHS